MFHRITHRDSLSCRHALRDHQAGEPPRWGKGASGESEQRAALDCLDYHGLRFHFGGKCNNYRDDAERRDIEREARERREREKEL